MVDEATVRRLAGALPGVTEAPGSAKFEVNGRGIAWPYLERVHPRKARVPRRDIIAVRTENEAVKRALIESDPEMFFTDDHYTGYPAVLVRLANIDEAQLRDLLADAHAAALAMKPPRPRKQ